MTEPTERTDAIEPTEIRTRRGGDKVLIFRMSGAAISLVAGVVYLFFHEYVTVLREHAGAAHTGLDSRGIVGLLFCFLLTLLFLYKEVGGFAKDLVEAIRAVRGKGD